MGQVTAIFFILTQGMPFDITWCRQYHGIPPPCFEAYNYGNHMSEEVDVSENRKRKENQNKNEKF